MTSSLKLSKIQAKFISRKMLNKKMPPETTDCAVVLSALTPPLHDNIKCVLIKYILNVKF